MKHKLPKTNVETIVLFPNNLRFITEYTFSDRQSHYIKVAIVSIVSLFLLALIFLHGVIFRYNINQQKLLSQQRVQLQSEVAYWKEVATKYQGYRDVDYRIAALEYRLGNVSESQEYVKRALQLDPNYPEGSVLGAQIGL
jgi:hypothetical protein